MIDPSELWVLEWSQPQKYFHVCTLQESMEINVQAFCENKQLDWILLAVVESHEEAHALAKFLEMEEVKGARALYQP